MELLQSGHVCRLYRISGFRLLDLKQGFQNQWQKAMHNRTFNIFNIPRSICICRICKIQFSAVSKPAEHAWGSGTVYIHHVSWQIKQIRLNKREFYRKSNTVLKCLQLRNVLFTHNSRKGIIIPQSRIQSPLSCDVCADSIFKLVTSLCAKQDSLCKDFQRGLTDNY